MRLIENESIREQLYVGELSSGLRLALVPKRGFAQKFAFFATNYGSIDLEFVMPGAEQGQRVPAGIAHFLEHKLFEEEWGSISTVFSQQGASSNAFTSQTLTAYMMFTSSDLETNMRTLLEFVQRPYFTPESVEKEKGIITQEIRLYRDMPDSRAYDAFLDGLYQRFPAKIPVIGTEDSVRSITPELLFKCHSVFYHPSNMAVIAVGDFDPEEIEKLVIESIQAQENPGPIQRIYPAEPAGPALPQQIIPMAVALPQFIFGFKDTVPRITGEALMRRRIAASMALDVIFGRGSAFFERNLRPNWIHEDFSVNYIRQPQFGFVLFGGTSPDPARVIDDIQQTAAAFVSAGIPQVEFERIRRKFYGATFSHLNQITHFAMWLVEYVFDDLTYLDFIRLITEIREEEVNQAAAELLQPENAASVIVVPKGNGNGGARLS